MFKKVLKVVFCPNLISWGIISWLLFPSILLTTGCERRKYQRYNIPYQIYEEIAKVIPDLFDEQAYKLAIEKAEEFEKEARKEIAKLDEQIEKRFEHIEETSKISRAVEKIGAETTQEVEDIKEKLKIGIEKRDYKKIRQLIDRVKIYTLYKLDDDSEFLKEAFPKMVENLEEDAEAVIKMDELERQIKAKFAYIKDIEETKQQLLDKSKEIRKISKEANSIVRNGLQPFDFKFLHDIKTDIDHSVKKFNVWEKDPCLEDMVKKYCNSAGDLKDKIQGIVEAEINADERKFLDIQNSYAKKTDIRELKGDRRELKHISDSAKVFAPLYIKDSEEYLKNLAELKKDIKEHMKVCKIWNKNNLKVNKIFKEGLRAEEIVKLEEIKDELEDYKKDYEKSAFLLTKLEEDIDSGIQRELNTYRRFCNGVRNLCEKEPELDKINSYSRDLENSYEKLGLAEKVLLEFRKYEYPVYELSREVYELRTEIKDKIETTQKKQKLYQLIEKLLAYDKEVTEIFSDNRIEKKEAERLERIKNNLKDYKEKCRQWSQAPELETLVNYIADLIEKLEAKIKGRI